MLLWKLLLEWLLYFCHCEIRFSTALIFWPTLRAMSLCYSGLGTGNDHRIPALSSRINRVELLMRDLLSCWFSRCSANFPSRCSTPCSCWIAPSAVFPLLSKFNEDNSGEIDRVGTLFLIGGLRLLLNKSFHNVMYFSILLEDTCLNGHITLEARKQPVHILLQPWCMFRWATL
jgi:hypothetical protein